MLVTAKDKDAQATSMGLRWDIRRSSELSASRVKSFADKVRRLSLIHI